MLDSALVSVVIIYILTETDALYEYLSLFRLTKRAVDTEYLDFRERAPALNFLKFLLIRRDTFILRLVNCPICLSIWTNVLFYCFVDFSFEVFYSIWLTWALYFMVKILKNKSLQDDGTHI